MPPAQRQLDGYLLCRGCRWSIALQVKNRLKVLRADRDLTQAQLANALLVSRQTINAIETGKFDPSLPLAFKIARQFKLSIEEVFEPEESDFQ